MVWQRNQADQLKDKLRSKSHASLTSEKMQDKMWPRNAGYTTLNPRNN